MSSDSGREIWLRSPKRPVSLITNPVMSSDAGNEFFEKALRSPKRSRTEEAEKGFEKNETKEKEKEEDEEDDDDDDDDDYVEEDFTPEEWERKKKDFLCTLCNKYGHYAISCPWLYFCPPFEKLNPWSERICWCCAEVLEKAHPNTPHYMIPTRAKFLRKPTLIRHII
ncbi:hypothetical protein AQUCO_08300060v1 [Aquilegia coerulea]|uniref:CCHC-type domain-containing protein n=1 Tax=Aquilegia coerulea TaxID=218851 RepID=A0A2G5C734_AQUCA|nr:hypothetical protein AQUCO_08300060v1 [Aquilegia coerulea]